MPTKVLITLAIILGIGIGVGAVVFGILILALGKSEDGPCTVIALGSAILAASAASLLAHLGGGFRQLDEMDDRDCG